MKAPETKAATINDYRGMWNNDGLSLSRFRMFYTINRPVALRDHVTNASFKRCVGILLMPKIDRAHKNYLTPEIQEGTHLREIFYGTLIFQQKQYDLY